MRTYDLDEPWKNCHHGDRCFYCNNPLSPDHEHDHFPIPKRAGGQNTVPTCKNCHDFKDRIPLVNWPIEFYLEAAKSLKMIPRILLAKMIHIQATGIEKDNVVGWRQIALDVRNKLEIVQLQLKTLLEADSEVVDLKAWALQLLEKIKES